MIAHGKTLIADGVVDAHFVCDLTKCKGACCVEGDLGAPLEEEELHVLDEIVEVVKPYLEPDGKLAIEQQGAYVLDGEGDYSTPTIGGRECAYAVREDGILKCGIEKAFEAGDINFQKPISCHLYPIRIGKHREHDALNYDEWYICSPACSLGAELKVPLYKFVKEGLIRKYGQEWYDQLVELIEDGDS